MTRYHSSNVKLSNPQLNKLKKRTRDGTEVTLNLSSNVIGDSNNETNFPQKKLSKMVKSGSFISDPLETNDQFEIVSSSDYISKKLEDLANKISYYKITHTVVKLENCQ